MVQSVPGGIDHKASAEQIAHIATLIPDERLGPRPPDRRSGAWTGYAREFDYGADAVIMHGTATPDELAHIIEVCRESVG